MYIDRLTLTHVKCFASASIPFCNPDSHADVALPNITLVVGVNGVGKTTILQSVAVALMGIELKDGGWLPRRWRQSGARADEHATLVPELRLHPTDGDVANEAPPELVTRIRPRGRGREILVVAERDGAWGREVYESTAPSLFLAAYGTGRRTDAGSNYDPDLRHADLTPRFQRLASLFRADHTLTPLAAWLPQSPRQAEVISLLATLIPGLTVTPRLEDGEILVDLNGNLQPVDSLSDGYRSFLGWAGDLLYQLALVCPVGTPLHALPGVVLVDEIGLHLHPDWQRSVVTTLSRTFPKLQFICTTHSPLIVGTVHAHNLVVASWAEAWVTVRPTDTSPYGLSGDQVLRSPAFGLEAVRAPEFQADLVGVARAASEGDDDAVLRYHRMLAYGAAGLDP
jgi:hypothetical protein